MAHDLLDSVWGSSIASDVSDLIGPSLFRGIEPWSHQREAFQKSLVEHRDVVVTTGTGSGKTECFLVPILSELLRESCTWPAPNPSPLAWDWWNHRTEHGQSFRYTPPVAQRGHETRTAAMRALLLYPLNALVEDQLVRLRRTLDSEHARVWLKANRQDNRLYFGRYTGRTPISGSCNSDAVARLRSELRKLSREAAAVAGSDTADFFQTLDGAEMWSRWDMQSHPPDLLITNYSMLNIMLMRSLEKSIFDQTQAWLAEDSSRVFYLVVDELHTYRGTPGTEVAYLLRVLLDRLGLRPDSTQLRIIASSASLEGDDDDLGYLERFFGRERSNFAIVRSSPIQPSAVAIPAIHTFAIPFRDFGRLARTDSFDLAAPAISLAENVGLGSADGDTGQLLHKVLELTKAGEAMQAACWDNDKGTPIPNTPADIGNSIFNVLPIDERAEAAEGLLVCLSSANPAPVKLRAHMFFRSLQGLWACTNPQCTKTVGRAASLPIGALYDQPLLSCACGARTLELLVCECCGEIFLGGYRREVYDDQGNVMNGEWFLSPDHPDLEAAPEVTFLDRRYENYAVFWPSLKGQPVTSKWDQANVRRDWKAATLNWREARISLSSDGDSRGFLYYVSKPNQEADQAYPAICPRCDEDRRR